MSSIRTEDGKVAVVQIAATIKRPAITAVEIAWGNQVLTIDGQEHALSDKARQLVDQLLEEVLHGTN